ncbi:glucose-1-phosphate thymidylyltransferase RfbA [Litoribrevibacter euphylliae]|uniref:Glucose-1-phosphate thymidylyltransferase n=1 Tax=Litoribrevibacter euphylliae TaxID=1834034 RepID=A0ABV7HG51_9GAMM
MKGIILAGGTGSRLFPITQGVSKQLLPIYDKPMIYYPLSVLMLAGIRDILIITTQEDSLSFKQLLGDGRRFGVNLQYKVQDKPNGIAEAFIIGEEFIGFDSVSLVLGDNIFFGQHFSDNLLRAVNNRDSATVFAYHVNNPTQFGVVAFDENLNITSIEEKPENPKSNYALTGLYFYDNDVVSYSKQITPSARNELEITSINQIYLEEKKLRVELLGRGFAWLDTGTHQSLLDAGNFVQTIEARQGFKIACLEEIAFNKGWLEKDAVLEIAKSYAKNSYGLYLRKIVEEDCK